MDISVDDLRLRNEHIYPDEKVLQSVLGPSFMVYEKIIDLSEEYKLTLEWKYYRDGKAWLCKFQKKKKTILWISAWDGFIKATFYFPTRIIEQVYDLDISPSQKDLIKSARAIGKTHPCTFELRDGQYLQDFKKVMELKISIK